MEAMTLFAEPQALDRTTQSTVAIDYYPTPGWFSHALFEERIAPRLAPDSVIIEPSAGDGSLLRAIPPSVRAFGVELDAALAAEAEATSGHRVIVGDVLQVAFPEPPTIAFANPPFDITFVEALLGRLHRGFVDGNVAAMILPAYMLQTSRTVERLATSWSIEVEMIPRDLFRGLEKPLVFASFVKERQRRFIGLAFYLETAAWQRMPQRFHEILSRSRKNVWVAAILAALEQLGGTGTVEQITRIVSGAPPSQVRSRFPRESIRKWLHIAFERIGPATYRIPESAAA
jgi:site-specific DNA-methyltransferase (adenine-specific)